jgi:hypothetical protein
MKPMIQLQVQGTFHYHLCTKSKADPDFSATVSERKSKKGGQKAGTVDFIDAIPPLMYLL